MRSDSISVFYCVISYLRLKYTEQTILLFYCITKEIISMNEKADKNHILNFRIILIYTILSLVLLLIGLFISAKNYLLFHSIVEFFSIIISFSILVISMNTFSFSKNNYFAFLGLAFGFVGCFDLLHTLAYKGMEVFPGWSEPADTIMDYSTRDTKPFHIILLLLPDS